MKSLRKTVTALVLLIPCMAVAAPILDQNHETATVSASGSISQTVTRGQTFTAGLTGILDSVEIALFRSSSATDTTKTMTVQVRDTSGTLPGAMTLGSLTVDLGDIPFFSSSTLLSSFSLFDFSSFGIGLTTGTQYSLVLTSNHPHLYSPSWTGSFNSTDYAGGEMHVLKSGNWVPQSDAGAGNGPGLDGFFRTYVEVGRVPEPGSLILFAIGLIGFVTAKRS